MKDRVRELADDLPLRNRRHLRDLILRRAFFPWRVVQPHLLQRSELRQGDCLVLIAMLGLFLAARRKRWTLQLVDGTEGN
ncbi:MAG: hypothetical protein ABW034_00515 [Steroidobacteraceae bacterium]